MKVLQKMGVLPQGGKAMLYRRAAERIAIQDANGRELAAISAGSWGELIRSIEKAPKSWFVVTDDSKLFDEKQVIYKLAREHLKLDSGFRIADDALPAIAPILLNEGTLSLYQGSVSHDQPPPSHAVARVYLWRGN